MAKSEQRPNSVQTDWARRATSVAEDFSAAPLAQSPHVDRLSVAGRLGALLVPWTFVLVFGGLYAGLLLPRVWQGHLLTTCIGVLVAFTLAVSVVAAVSFSRDVLTGRWP